MLNIVKNASYALLSIYLYCSFAPINHIDKELKPLTKELFTYVHRYCKDGQYNNPNRKSIKFANLKSPIVGECEIGKGYYAIRIDDKYWHSIKYDEQYDLMAHELAHCLIFKEHVDNPDNYMYYETTNLTKEIIKKQFIEDLKEYCDE